MQDLSPFSIKCEEMNEISSLSIRDRMVSKLIYVADVVWKNDACIITNHRDFLQNSQNVWKEITFRIGFARKQR